MPGSRALESEKSRWTFLTNHAHTLVLLSQNSELVLREVAHMIGITERAVQRIVSELEADGFITREKIGRRNRYSLNATKSLRHKIEEHKTVGDLLNMLKTT